MTIKGHLDGLEGTYVVGWAVSQLDSNCKIEVTDPDDNVLAAGLACLDRNDLARVAQGRCDVAFRIPLPVLGDVTHLHVRADGIELPNSPLRVGIGIFDGHLTTSHGTVAGWVAERRAGFVPPVITICDQYGRVVLLCQSTIDVSIGDARFIAARFAGDLSDACFGQGELSLSAFANGVKFAQTSCNLPLQGRAETVHPDRCTGWLLSPSAPERRFSIEVIRDGQVVATTICDIPRPDVQSVFPAARRPGFDVALRKPLPGPLDFTSISFRLAGGSRDLLDGPYVIGNRPGIIAAARNISRLSLQSGPGGLSPAEKVVLRAAVVDFIGRARLSERLSFGRQTNHNLDSAAALLMQTRLNVIVPIYQDVTMTRACIESVLECRSPGKDRLILINDHSPEIGMVGLLASYTGMPNVFVLTNSHNLGFVQSVNRGLSFCGEGDVVLLNSDTRLFPGALSELWNVAHTAPDIGTVTALSNNATIFSYPHSKLRRDRLDDVDWRSIAERALEANRGVVIDVPTGHGFCMLIRCDVLRMIGHLDEAFGRGYGEENDFCARAADLGYRNVAAAGVFVEHRESASFGGERAELLARNMSILETRYPEYAATIAATESRDDLRRARWALDSARLGRAVDGGMRFVLIVCHNLAGGTDKAITDIEATVGYGGAHRITLCCRADGAMELAAETPLISGLFAADETAALFSVLATAGIELIVVHHVVGFPAAFLAELRDWISERRGVFYARDFYPICPRVNLIDAVGEFCNVASTAVCRRCLALGGPHEASRLDTLDPDEHRAAFAALLGAVTHVVVPSESVAGYFRSAFPNIMVDHVPHPAPRISFPENPRDGDDEEIVLLGALGPHKGSATLVDLAQRARLTHPSLRFRVIGYTDRDEDLRRIGNVEITGPYEPRQLPELVRATAGRLALFLSGWPETFSYTLTEAAYFGFVPLVPDIGALAERVRGSGYGMVFPFPIRATEILGLIGDIGTGRIVPWRQGRGPASLAPSPDSIARTQVILHGISPGRELAPRGLLAERS